MVNGSSVSEVAFAASLFLPPTTDRPTPTGIPLSASLVNIPSSYFCRHTHSHAHIRTHVRRRRWNGKNCGSKNLLMPCFDLRINFLLLSCDPKLSFSDTFRTYFSHTSIKQANWYNAMHLLKVLLNAFRNLIHSLKRERFEYVVIFFLEVVTIMPRIRHPLVSRQQMVRNEEAGDCIYIYLFSAPLTNFYSPKKWSHFCY